MIAFLVLVTQCDTLEGCEMECLYVYVCMSVSVFVHKGVGVRGDVCCLHLAVGSVTWQRGKHL